MFISKGDLYSEAVNSESAVTIAIIRHYHHSNYFWMLIFLFKTKHLSYISDTRPVGFGKLE